LGVKPSQTTPKASPNGSQTIPKLSLNYPQTIPRLAPDRPQTGPILWATGAEGLAHLSQALDRPVGKGVKGQSVLLGHAAPEAAQIFADGLHVVPQADGTTAVG
jgi:hypothetical protein